MTRFFLIVALTAALDTSAIAQEKNGSLNTGPAGRVTGTVYISPACPGPAQINRPECVRRPVQAAVNVFAGGTSAEKEASTNPLMSVATNTRGQFSFAIGAGSYRLVPVSSSGKMRGKPAFVTVRATSTTRVELVIDSGLR